MVTPTFMEKEEREKTIEGVQYNQNNDMEEVR